MSAQVWKVTYDRDRNTVVAERLSNVIHEAMWEARGNEFGVDAVTCYVKASTEDSAVTAFWRVIEMHIDMGEVF